MPFFSATEYINEVLGYFREEKLPIVWVQHINKSAGVVPGAKGFEVIDILDKNDDELTIHKTYGNTFNKTDLEDYFRQEDVDVIVLTGYCAENCVLSTYRGALDLDFTPVLLKNGVASGSKENLKFVEKISDTVPYNIVKKML